MIEQLLSRDTTNIDWELIHGLFANAIYGGRVDDVHDIRILTSYLQDMFQQEVIAAGKKQLGPLNLPGAGAGLMLLSFFKLKRNFGFSSGSKANFNLSD